MEHIRRENALNLPNLLTALRIALLPGMICCFRRGDMHAALGLYLLTVMTDIADGFFARRYDQVTSVGKLLDPAADKLTLLTILVLFASDGQIRAWVVWAVLVKELLLVIGSAAALACGIVVYALPAGKIATGSFAVSTAVRFLGFMHLADALLSLSLALSFAALIWYALSLLGKYRVCNTVSTK